MADETATAGTKQALLQAYDQVIKRQAEEREAERQAALQRKAESRSRPIAWTALVTALLMAAYLWLERPSWLFPPPPPVEPVAVKEASLRIAMASAAQHVERFRQRNGRLPRTLAEAGAHGYGISYQAGDSSYTMRGINGPVQLSLRSTDSLPRFLGNSFEVISRRTR